MEDLRINPELVTRILTGFIADEVRKIGFERVILGLSGGIDSALVAYLSARALGAANVTVLMMPYRTSSPDSRGDAETVVEALGIEAHLEGITPMVDGYFAAHPEATALARGNFMARQRMAVLYDWSARTRALVIGTSNKTEYLLGYSTIWGDSACALNPIGDLYKTQVRQLARHVGVPERIIDKPPSADLWAGQTDETEMGWTYDAVDRVLYLLVDRRYTVAEMEREGYAPEFVRKVFRTMQTSQFKRRLPILAKLSDRTIDRDFRYPRDWGC